MKLIFIDENANSQKNENFLGIGILKIDLTKYKLIKESFRENLEQMGWDLKKEFKGKFLFSKKGDKSIDITKRIEFVSKLIDYSKSVKNTRYQFYFYYNFRGTQKENYLKLLKTGLSKCIDKCNIHKNGKDVYAIFLDSRDDLKYQEISELCEKIISEKDCTLLERPFLVNSSNNTPGIIIVDILSYLASWYILNPNPSDTSLFQEKLSEPIRKKVETVHELLKRLGKKNFQEISKF